MRALRVCSSKRMRISDIRLLQAENATNGGGADPLDQMIEAVDPYRLRQSKHATRALAGSTPRRLATGAQQQQGR